MSIKITPKKIVKTERGHLANNREIAQAICLNRDKLLRSQTKVATKMPPWLSASTWIIQKYSISKLLYALKRKHKNQLKRLERRVGNRKVVGYCYDIARDNRANFRKVSCVGNTRNSLFTTVLTRIPPGFFRCSQNKLKNFKEHTLAFHK